MPNKFLRLRRPQDAEVLPILPNPDTSRQDDMAAARSIKPPKGPPVELKARVSQPVFKVGERVRLKVARGGVSEWTIIGRSFGDVSYDVASGNFDEPDRILHGLKPESLVKIETP